MWRSLCAVLVALLACLFGLLTFLVDPWITDPPRHHQVDVRTATDYAVTADQTGKLPVLLLMTEAVNAAMVTHALLVADAARPFFQVHLASFGGAYAKLLEESGFAYHVLSPVWTEEQTAAIYAVDQFESFSSPYTKEVLQEQISSSLQLYSKIAPSAVVAFFVLSASISARIARLPLFVDMSMTRETSTDPRAIAVSMPDSGVVAKLGLRTPLSHMASWLMKRLNFITPAFEAVAREWNITGIHLVWDLMEGDYTVISDIPSWAGVDAAALPPQVTYVGPLYGKLKKDIPKEVLQLRERATSEKQPLVWFAMGSSGQPPLVLATLRELLKQQPKWFIVAPVHALLAKLKINASDASAKAEAGLDSPQLYIPPELLPSQKVEPLCDLALTHGGQGTVHTSMCSGVPFVGVGMMPEQDLNIRLAVNKGMAIQAMKFDPPSQIAGLMHDLAHSPEMRIAASKIREECQEYTGEYAFVELIQQKLAGK
ncbi:unnamed protein product [Cladocopium goreaui]|uniref:Glycosyl transferase n=1 Tax=Cladocopium goreaui TaxID=2562237 RepID=A0A9P1FW29_9DINO|nr:unnamed protein product [Cladocopium goreaui]